MNCCIWSQFFLLISCSHKILVHGSLLKKHWPQRIKPFSHDIIRLGRYVSHHRAKPTWRASQTYQSPQVTGELCELCHFPHIYHHNHSKSSLMKNFTETVHLTHNLCPPPHNCFLPSLSCSFGWSTVWKVHFMHLRICTSYHRICCSSTCFNHFILFCFLYICLFLL